MLSSTDPKNGAIQVAINRKIAATFSEAMDPATLTETTFTLMKGTTPVSGIVTWAGMVATFTPTNHLIVGARYTASITSGATDLAGNAIAKNSSWNFTAAFKNGGGGSGGLLDTSAPTLSSKIPAQAAVNVAINSILTVVFNEAMDPFTITTDNFTLQCPALTSISGTVGYASNGTVATFTPTSDLPPSTNCTATITTDAADLAGNVLAAEQVWSFTTGVAPDVTAPTMSFKIPAQAATNVALDSILTATFNEAMDPLTITTDNFTLQCPALTSISGTVGYGSNGTVATFTPTSNLPPSTNCTATITTEAADLAGNILAAEQTWSFTTGVAPLDVIDLGTTSTFAILTKTGVTNVPTSSITGHIGASPITGAAIGLTCAQVTGAWKIYKVDAAGTPAFDAACNVTAKTFVDTAVSDMQIAYLDAEGRTLPNSIELAAGHIGGQVIGPGLYKWTTDVDITTDVTISGGANDVWIFQITGNLSIAGSKSVNLIGGAQAKNIFWQVAGGTGVSIATNAHFEGTILALTGISLLTGANVTGRLLAQTAVTLQGNVIEIPE